MFRKTIRPTALICVLLSLAGIAISCGDNTEPNPDTPHERTTRRHNDGKPSEPEWVFETAVAKVDLRDDRTQAAKDSWGAVLDMPVDLSMTNQVPDELPEPPAEPVAPELPDEPVLDTSNIPGLSATGGLSSTGVSDRKSVV